MRTRLISGAELTGLRALAEDAELFEQKAKYHVQVLAREFDGTISIGGLPKFKVTAEANGRVLGRITSQFGQGRFVLNLTTKGENAQGALVVEKETADKSGNATWTPAMRIPLPYPAWEVDGEKIRDPDKAYMLGASILHAVINGPDEA